MEQLGIVKGVDIGMRDCSEPVMWFGVETLNGGSLQVFNMDEAARLIKDAGAYRIKDLEGRPCVVDTKAGSMVFVRWHQ